MDSKNKYLELNAGAEPETVSAQLIFLSIVLIMIVYFIFLNALGKPSRNKSNLAINSVRSSLTYSAISRSSLAPISANETKDLKLDPLRKLASLLADKFHLMQAVPFSNEDTVNAEDQFLLTFPEGTVFTEDNEIRAEVLPIFADVAEASVEQQLFITINAFSSRRTRQSASNPEDISDKARVEPPEAALERSMLKGSVVYRYFLDAGVTPDRLVSRGRIADREAHEIRISIAKRRAKIDERYQAW